MASLQHYVYVVSDDKLPAEFICTVCHDVAGTHTACPGCSQTFCQACVHRWFNTQKSNVQGCTCPYCRRKLKFSDLKHDPSIQQKLDQLLVYCPNKSEGCPAKIPRAAVAAHLNRECALQQCSCQFCELQGLRADIKQHEESSCSKRLVPCVNCVAGCSVEVPMHLMPIHLDHVCDVQTKSCPQCSQAVPRKDWSEHLQAGCPAQQFCPLRLYGCSYCGTAADVQRHSQSCSYLAQQQQQEQQLALGSSDRTLATAAAAATLKATDTGELPSDCLIDEYGVFAARTMHSSAAAACQMLLNAVPAAVTPARLQPHLDLLGEVSALESQQKPAALAAQTPPRRIHADEPASSASFTQDAPGVWCLPHAGTGGCSDSGLMLPSGMSPAEALALGWPQCFRLLGLESHPNLEAAWRIALNLSMIDVLSSEAGEAAAPSSFMLYTTLIRAWEVLSGRYGMLQSPARQQHQQQGIAMERTEEVREAHSCAYLAQQQHTIDARSQNDSSSSHDSQGTSDSRSSQQTEHGSAATAGLGLERGLSEEEYEKMHEYIVEQRETMAAVAAAIGCVQQLWIKPGLMLLLPDHARELEELAETVEASLMIMSSIASPKKQTTSSRNNSSRRNTQQQQQPGSRDASVGTLEAAATPATPAAGAAGSGAGQQQQQQQQQHRPFWFQQISRVMPAAFSAVLGAPEGAAGQEQQHTGEPAAAGGVTVPANIRNSNQGAADSEPSSSETSAAVSSDQCRQDNSNAAGPSSSSSSSRVQDFQSAMKRLNQLAVIPAVCKPRQQGVSTHDTMLHALERCTCVLVLHHLRAEHLETSMIPELPAGLMSGHRGVWGTSVLAAASSQLGPGFQLGWQSTAVLSDMVSGLAGRVLQVIGEGFYDSVEGRVPLSPELAMAAVKLVIPPGMLSACLERLSVLSIRYHDEECDDLTEVTWQQLATRIGLTIELDKLVLLVDARLPVTLDEDEDEDMEEGSDDGSSAYAHNEEEEYTTDDEYHVPITATRAGSRFAASAATTAAREADNGDSGGDDDDDDDDGSGGGWESADSDEVMELLGPERNEGQQQQQQQAAGLATTEDPLADTNSLPSLERLAAAAAAAQGAAGASGYNQQCEGLAPAAPEAAEPTAFDAGMDWQQEFATNLQQLATASADMSLLEQHILQSAVHGMRWLAAAAGQAFNTEDQDVTAGMHIPGFGPRQGGASEVQGVDAQASDRDSSGTAHAPASANTGTVAHTVALTEGQSQQQQQQQQQPRDRESKEKEAGDATTHGVVLIAGLVECVLMQLLTGAAKAAARQAAVEQAAAAGSQVYPGADGVQPSSHLPPQQQQKDGGIVYVSARHVLLAATEDKDLRSLIIERPVDQQYHNPAAVAWAGVVPDMNAALLPDPKHQPLTAWLMQIASGRIQHHQHREQDHCSGISAVVFPADLHYYCGRKWEAPVAAEPTATRVGAGSSTSTCSADGAGTSDGAAHHSNSRSDSPQSDTAAVVCCYLSGWQCSSCAAATAAMAAKDIDQQLEAAFASLQGVAAVPRGLGSSINICGGFSLSSECLQQLQVMTRMYHLQQPWWCELTSPGSSSTLSSGNGCGSVRDIMSPADLVQLAHVQQLLTPLRDVVAIREVHLQQQQEGLVWPRQDFSALVEEALEAVMGEKQQQTALQKRLQRLVVHPAAGGSSVAAITTEEDPSDASGCCDMDLDDEALTLLATAAEDFLVQQFRSASELAMYAGRDEVVPEDLRMAMGKGGYRHMVPAAAHAGAGRENGPRTIDLKQLYGL